VAQSPRLGTRELVERGVAVAPLVSIERGMCDRGIRGIDRSHKSRAATVVMSGNICY